MKNYVTISRCLRFSFIKWEEVETGCQSLYEKIPALVPALALITGLMISCKARVRRLTRVGDDEVSALVVEGAVSGAGGVSCPGQALVPEVHSIAVIQQRLSYLGMKM